MRAILTASLVLGALLFPAAAVADTHGMDASASNSNLPVSTGVYSPSILQTANVLCSPKVYGNFPDGATVVLKLKVDAEGRADNIQLLKPSVDPRLDQPVIAAVRDFSWRPAYLDHHPISDNVILKVEVSH